MDRSISTKVNQRIKEVNRCLAKLKRNQGTKRDSQGQEINTQLDRLKSDIEQLTDCLVAGNCYDTSLHLLSDEFCQKYVTDIRKALQRSKEHTEILLRCLFARIATIIRDEQRFDQVTCRLQAKRVHLLFKFATFCHTEGQESATTSSGSRQRRDSRRRDSQPTGGSAIPIDGLPVLLSLSDLIREFTGMLYSDENQQDVVKEIRSFVNIHYELEALRRIMIEFNEKRMISEQNIDAHTNNSNHIDRLRDCIQKCKITFDEIRKEFERVDEENYYEVDFLFTTAVEDIHSLFILFLGTLPVSRKK